MRPLPLALFVAVLPVWTYLLLVPNPVPPVVRDLLGFWDHAAFVAAKSLHAGAYAFLTLAGAVGFGRRFAVWVALAMAAHGAATEYGQTFVPNRTGKVLDAVIDAAGAAAGGVAARRWGRGQETSPPGPLSDLGRGGHPASESSDFGLAQEQ